jgi:CelD/BcsL family acetyltransferase involved in cellulose biosynthesis
LSWRLAFGDSDFEHLLPVSAWQDLHHPETDCIMASPAWTRAWWHAFGKRSQPGCLLAQNGAGVPAGVIPLRRSRASAFGLRLRTIALVENGSTPRAAAPLARTGFDVRQGLELLLDSPGEWDALALRKVPRDSRLWEELTQVLRERDGGHVRRLAVSSPFLKIESSWEDWCSSRSQKFRKTMRNQRNRARRLENPRVREIADPAGLDGILEEYESLCTRTWKHRAGTGLMDSPEKREFLRQLIRFLGDSGNLVLWALYGSVGLIAAELHVRDACGTHALRSDFDEAFKDYSPGSALEIAIVEESFRRGYREHDFCGEDYAYKLRWTDQTRSCDDFLVFAPRLRPTLVRAWERSIKPAVKRVAAACGWVPER